jgi:AcrR family transcriptional regulator
MERDKTLTKQKLIDAVGAIVLRAGFQGLGINAVAKEAGVDKVLIYRYFGSMEGLIQEFINSKDYFSNINTDVEIKNEDDVAELGAAIFTGQLKNVLKNKELQEILLWELTNNNEITRLTAEKRELDAMKIINEISRIVDFNKTDIPAITSVILAGIYYLVLRSRSVDVFNGIDLTDEKGWERIEKAISFMIKNSLNEEKH